MPKALAALTVDDFEPCKGKTFQVATASGVLELELVEVRRLGPAMRDGGAFSLALQSAPGPFCRRRPIRSHTRSWERWKYSSCRSGRRTAAISTR